jgi:hypothetical protein
MALEDTSGFGIYRVPEVFFLLAERQFLLSFAVKYML